MMERIPLRENGLVGTFFRQGRPKAAVIYLGGSSGVLSDQPACALASRGFLSLALAYFATDPLPPRLESVPLEYFERAIQRVKEESGIEKIALWGGSRGAELALILGTLFPNQIDAIAAHVPSSVVFGTLDREGGVAWTYRNQPILPSAPFKYTQKTMGECRDSAILATPCFLKAMQDREAFERASIPVEKLRSPLLLISAGDDQMWPSKLFADQIVERLRKYGSSIPFFHLSYEHVGHAPSKGEIGLHAIMNRWFVFGGSPKENAKASVEWVEKTIRFFQDYLS